MTEQPLELNFLSHRPASVDSDTSDSAETIVPEPRFKEDNAKIQGPGSDEADPPEIPFSEFRDEMSDREISAVIEDVIDILLSPVETRKLFAKTMPKTDPKVKKRKREELEKNQEKVHPEKENIRRAQRKVHSEHEEKRRADLRKWLHKIDSILPEWFLRHAGVEMAKDGQQTKEQILQAVFHHMRCSRKAIEFLIDAYTSLQYSEISSKREIEVQNCELEAQNQQLEIQNYQLETWNQRLEVRIQQLELSHRSYGPLPGDIHKNGDPALDRSLPTRPSSWDSLPSSPESEDFMGSVRA